MDKCAYFQSAFVDTGLLCSYGQDHCGNCSLCQSWQVFTEDYFHQFSSSHNSVRGITQSPSSPVPLLAPKPIKPFSHIMCKGMTSSVSSFGDVISYFYLWWYFFFTSAWTFCLSVVTAKRMEPAWRTSIWSCTIGRSNLYMLGTCSCPWYHSHQALQHLTLRQKVLNKGRLLIRFRFLNLIILLTLLSILNQVYFALTNIDPELVHTMWSLALESLNEVFPLNIVFVLSTWKYDDQEILSKYSF